MSIYEDHVLDHYKNQRNAGVLKNPDIEFTDTNPLCGDTITITLHVKNGKIIAAQHNSEGCAVSQAAASMLFEQLEGMTIKQVLKINKELLLGEFGGELSVSRVKCALLALSALKKAVIQHA